MGGVDVLTATFGRAGEPLTILCLGAHCDDIEIGAGGTLLRLLSERPGSRVRWLVFSSNAEREAEARASAAEFLADAGAATVDIHTYRESFFPFVGASIKDCFESIKAEESPDLIFTHRTIDAHQDHRTIAELTWNTFRNHVIAEYEIPKYEGDLGQPQVFAPLPRATAERKVSIITDKFKSQATRSWFSAETFLSLMRIRGVECNAPSGYAEAFHVRKLTI